MRKSKFWSCRSKVSRLFGATAFESFEDHLNDNLNHNGVRRPGNDAAVFERHL